MQQAEAKLPFHSDTFDVIRVVVFIGNGALGWRWGSACFSL